MSGGITILMFRTIQHFINNKFKKNLINDFISTQKCRLLDMWYHWAHGQNIQRNNWYKSWPSGFKTHLTSTWSIIHFYFQQKHTLCSIVWCLHISVNSSRWCIFTLYGLYFRSVLLPRNLRWQSYVKRTIESSKQISRKWISCQTRCVHVVSR